MKIQFIRHATTLIWINNKKLLVDPLLSQKGAYCPIKKVPNQNLNPLIELPITLDELTDCDGILVTHLHRDHFDQAAINRLSKKIPVFCQPQDASKLSSYGFKSLFPINHQLNFEGIHFYRTGARHGHGLLALKMAPVSGFVISASGEPVLYFPGDTVWCSHVKKALAKYAPDLAITYFGSAQFSFGKPITMGKEDLVKFAAASPHTNIVCIHMDAWNHCQLSKQDLKDYAISQRLTKVIVPSEGTRLDFNIT